MVETNYIYVVHSDVDENNVYAEFKTEEEAIEYAKDHIEDEPWVDRVEVTLDDEGDVDEMLDSETIWAYDDLEEEIKLTEAPDEDGVLTDDELDDEYQKELAELQARAKARKEAAAKEREANAKKAAKESSLTELGKEKLSEIDNAEGDDDIEKFFNVLVPASGPAGTIGGELVRAMMKLLYRDYNDGDVFYKGYGLETCGNAAQFLVENTPFEEDIVLIAENRLENSSYTEALEALAKKLCDSLREDPKLLVTESSLDYQDIDGEEAWEAYIPRDYEYELSLSETIIAHMNKGNIDIWDVKSEVENWFDLDNSLNGAEVARPWSYSDTYVTVENLTEEGRDTLEQWDRHNIWEDYERELEDEYGDPNFDPSDVGYDEIADITIGYGSEKGDARRAAELIYTFYDSGDLWEELSDFKNTSEVAEEMVTYIYRELNRDVNSLDSEFNDIDASKDEIQNLFDCLGLGEYKSEDEEEVEESLDKDLTEDTKEEAVIIKNNILKKAPKELAGEYVIPEGVTSIGEGAFYKCSGLTSIVIPEGVTSIGDNAFFGCYSLTDIELPSTLESIGEFAFSRCSSLTNIIIPEGVTSIGNSAFSYCRSLTSIIIPDSVTSIGNYAFEDCSSLTNIIIPEGVTSIGECAFYNCDSLTSITLPDSVTSIGESAFSYCSSLTNITIPETVTSIESWAFEGCSSLTSITIPDSVTSIGYRAFEDCSSLTIYCEATSQPDGWHTSWNEDEKGDIPVKWGYKKNKNESIKDEMINEERETVITSPKVEALTESKAHDVVEYVCWIDAEGDQGTTFEYSTFEAAKEACIENNYYSVEKQVRHYDENDNLIDDIETEEVWVNPEYDPSYDPDQALEEDTKLLETNVKALYRATVYWSFGYEEDAEEYAEELGVKLISYDTDSGEGEIEGEYIPVAQEAVACLAGGDQYFSTEAEALKALKKYDIELKQVSGRNNEALEEDKSIEEISNQEVLDKPFTFEEAKQYCKELITAFYEDGSFYDLYPQGSNDNAVIECQIDNGDWKHDHLYFEHFVNHFFFEKNVRVDISSQSIEDDNLDDCYSAVYTIKKEGPVFINDEKPEQETVNIIELEEAKKYNEPKNLQACIDKLNAPYHDEEYGEDLDSSFDFTLKEEDGVLYLYDRNENYNIDYEYEMNMLIADAAAEFGYEAEYKEDDIHKQLEAAAKKDFGNDAYLEWEDTVRMIVVRG